MLLLRGNINLDAVIEGIKERKIQGTINVPGDKSITHRAVILTSIAHGVSQINNFSEGLDCKSTMRCMQAMGIQIKRVGDTIIKINGKGFKGLNKPQDILNVGNSGTTIRLLSGLLSGQSFHSILDGDDSIRKRPMKRIIEPLSLMNATIKGLFHDNFAPLSILGKPLKGIDYTLPIASAQVKSAILLAGLYALGDTIIREPECTRDHTERMLALMHADIQSFPEQKILLKPGKELKAINIDIPGDISSAAYFLALGCTSKDTELTIKNVGINPTRIAFINLLKKMGAELFFLNKDCLSNEPRADIKVKGNRLLKGIHIEGKVIPNIIDELPLVAVIATQAQGKTVVSNAQELRVKETDRIRAIVEGLSRMGAKIVEKPDGFEIFGTTELSGNIVDSYNDHRIAMSLAIAASFAKGKTVIREFQCVDISFPGFIKNYYDIIK